MDAHRLVNPLAQYPFGTAVLLALTWAFALAMQRVSEWYPDFVRSQIIFALLGLAAGLASARLRYLAKHMLEAASSAAVEYPSQTAASWSAKQEVCIFHGLPPYLVAAVTAVASAITNNIAGLPWQGATRWSFFVAVLLLFASLGALVTNGVSLLQTIQLS